MSEHATRALADHVRALVRANEVAIKELRRVVAPLEVLPELFKQQGDTIVKSIAGQTHALAELELGALTADLASAQALGGELEGASAQLTEQLDEELAALRERYDRIQDELSAAAASRIGELDGPALAVMEEDAASFRERYAQDLLPHFELLAEEAGVFCGLREISVGESLERLGEAAARVLESRVTVRRWVQEVAVDRGGDRPDEAELHALPIVTVVGGREGQAPSSYAIHRETGALRGGFAGLTLSRLNGSAPEWPARHPTRPIPPEVREEVLRRVLERLYPNGHGPPAHIEPSDLLAMIAARVLFDGD